MRKNLIENVESGIAYRLVGMHTSVHAEERRGGRGEGAKLSSWSCVVLRVQIHVQCTLYRMRRGICEK